MLQERRLPMSPLESHEQLFDPLLYFGRNTNRETMPADRPPPRQLLLFSFGHRYGRPPRESNPLERADFPTANMIVDARVLPNPPKPIRQLHTGLSKTFQETFFSDEMNESFYEGTLERVKSYLVNNVDEFDPDDLVAIAIGCEMGRHRSVATVERLAGDLRRLLKDDWNVNVFHRDLYKKKQKKPEGYVKVPTPEFLTANR